jgi:hypothetical protein
MILREMVECSAKHDIKAVIKTYMYPLEKLNQSVEECKAGYGGKLAVDYDFFKG